MLQNKTQQKMSALHPGLGGPNPSKTYVAEHSPASGAYYAMKEVYYYLSWLSTTSRFLISQKSS